MGNRNAVRRGCILTVFMLFAVLLLAGCNVQEPLSSLIPAQESVGGADGVLQDDPGAAREGVLPYKAVPDGETLRLDGAKRYIGEVDSASVDLADLEMMTNVFVTPLLRSDNAVLQTWEQPDQLEADYFVRFCGINNLLARPLVETGDGLEYADAVCTAQELEQAVQGCFDVTSDFLRTSRGYDAAADSYTMPSYAGGGREIFAMEAVPDGQRLMITVGISMPGQTDSPDAAGLLTVELGQASFRYLSYTVDEG